MKHMRCAAALAAVAAPLPGTAASNASVGSLRATLTRWRLPAPVYRTVAVASAGRIFVLGGHDSSGGSITAVYSFDPRTGGTGVAGHLALPTHGAAAAPRRRADSRLWWRLSERARHGPVVQPGEA